MPSLDRSRGGGRVLFFKYFYSNVIRNNNIRLLSVEGGPTNRIAFLCALKLSKVLLTAIWPSRISINWGVVTQYWMCINRSAIPNEVISHSVLIMRVSILDDMGCKHSYLRASPAINLYPKISNLFFSWKSNSHFHETSILVPSSSTATACG